MTPQYMNDVEIFVANKFHDSGAKVIIVESPCTRYWDYRGELVVFSTETVRVTAKEFVDLVKRNQHNTVFLYAARYSDIDDEGSPTLEIRYASYHDYKGPLWKNDPVLAFGQLFS